MINLSKKYFPELGFEITWEPLSLETKSFDLKTSKLLQNIYEEIREGKNVFAETLENYIREYPDIPIFRNYLASHYILADDLIKAEEVNEKCLIFFPDYLFALLNRANLFFMQELYEKIPSALKSLDDLRVLQPGRNVFHVSEVFAYFQIVIMYYLAIDEFDKAIKTINILEMIDISYPEYKTIVDKVQKYILSKHLKLHEELWQNEKKVKALPLTTEQIQDPPVFNHPEINKLYDFDIEIDGAIIAEILALPRESLVEDLKTVIYDSLKRYNFFLTKPASNCFSCIHALLISAELKAVEVLPAIFDFLKNDDEFIQFWLGDFLSDDVWEILYKLTEGNVQALVDFIKQPNIEFYPKYTAAETLTQHALNQPETQQYIINCYRDLFSFLIENQSDENLLDTILIEFLFEEVKILRATELLDLVKILNDDILKGAKYIDDFVTMKELFEKPSEPSDINEIHPDIYAHYQDLILLQNYEEEDFGDDYDEDFDEGYDNYEKYDEIERSHNLFLKESKNNPYPKTGRNDPCPCGSGKKYKKCCLK